MYHDANITAPKAHVFGKVFENLSSDSYFSRGFFAIVESHPRHMRILLADDDGDVMNRRDQFYRELYTCGTCMKDGEFHSMAYSLLYVSLCMPTRGNRLTSTELLHRFLLIACQLYM